MELLTLIKVVVLERIGLLGIKMGEIKFTLIVTAFNHQKKLLSIWEMEINYNTDQVQPRGEVFCGHLCLYILKELNDGKEFQNILNNFF